MVRKSQSILILILLAFSLQSAEIHAFSFQSVTNTVCSWFKEKSTFILGAVIFCATCYIFSKAKKSKKTCHVPKEKKKSKLQTTQKNFPEPNKQYEIVNLDVLQQNNNLQCGYHSLKNGILCFEAHRFNQFVDTSDLNRFTQDKVYSQFFNDWRTFISKERKKQVLKEYLQPQLLNLLIKKIKSPVSEDISDLILTQYRTHIRNCASSLAEQTVESLAGSFYTGLNYSISTKMIQSLVNTNYIFDTIMASDRLPLNCTTLEKKNVLKEFIDNIDTFLPTLNKFETITIDQSFLNNLVKQKYNQVEENLESDELTKLLQHTCNIVNIRKHFSFFGDVSQLDKKENYDPEIKLNWQQYQNYIHIFSIGTMSEKYANMSGHWFMVAAQKLNGQKKFYVADSLGIDRRNDQRVLKIINYLEH